MSRRFNLMEGDAEGCGGSACKVLVFGVFLLVLLVVPCDLSVRRAPFTIDGTPYSSTCLSVGQRTVGCSVEAE